MKSRGQEMPKKYYLEHDASSFQHGLSLKMVFDHRKILPRRFLTGLQSSNHAQWLRDLKKPFLECDTPLFQNGSP
jgi:hypothetical protein